MFNDEAERRLPNMMGLRDGIWPVANRHQNRPGAVELSEWCVGGEMVRATRASVWFWRRDEAEYRDATRYRAGDRNSASGRYT